MFFVVDRIEENFVVVELNNKKIINIPIDFFPERLEEGKKYSLKIEKQEMNIKSLQDFKNMFKTN